MSLTPYVNFNMNAREAVAYYEQYLGAKLLGLFPFSQAPDQTFPPELQDAVMHFTIEIDGAKLQGCDTPGGRWQPMRSAYLCLRYNTIEEAEKAYAALHDGGEVFMAMQETFFAIRFAQLRDKFGVNWMIIQERPMP